MNIEEYREYCLSLPEVEESLPFDNNVLVYKVGGKIFSLASIDGFDHFAVKCEPDKAAELRDTHIGVTPAFHLNKTHWNDITVVGSLSEEFQREQILNSYLLVVNKSVTPKALRLQLIEIANDFMAKRQGRP